MDSTGLAGVKPEMPRAALGEGRLNGRLTDADVCCLSSSTVEFCCEI